jgi:adenosylcobinamide-GDP ribazoletransferase
LKKEWKIFLSGLMFLTRLPVPKNIDHHEEYLQKSPKYFPLIGCMVAAVSFAAFFIFHKYVAENIGLLSLMIAGIFTTGAFHEDGFADTCDAFGGGWTKEKILSIMKDSRLGTYGVAGLVLMLAAKFLLLKELIAAFSFSSKNEWQLYFNFAMMLMAAHAVSRLMSVLVIQSYQYVTADDESKSKPLASGKLPVAELNVAILFALFPFLFLPYHFLLSLVFIVPSAFLLANYFKKWIGGYTGDCLGAVQQVTEIIFYLSVLMIWKYIS